MMLGWYVIYGIVRLGARLAQILPINRAYAIAGFIFGWSFQLWSTKRRHTQENVARILDQHPEHPAVRQLAQDAWKNFGKYFVEFLRMPALHPSDLAQLVTVQGVPILERALAHPQGVIFVQAHFGNMDLPSTVLSRYNRAAVVAADSLKPPAMMRWAKRTRARWNLDLVPNKGCLPILQKTLEAGGLVGLAVDVGVHQKGKGIGVKFFGEDSTFPAGPALLAQRTNAVIVPTCAIRQPDGRFTVVVDEPVVFQFTGDLAHDLQVVTQKMVHRLEAFIRAHPEQWYIFRPVWRSGRSSSL
jgi:KDO2-lipid IV(A) lauroyltransferase